MKVQLWRTGLCTFHRMKCYAIVKCVCPETMGGVVKQANIHVLRENFSPLLEFLLPPPPS